MNQTRLPVERDDDSIAVETCAADFPCSNLYVVPLQHPGLKYNCMRRAGPLQSLNALLLREAFLSIGAITGSIAWLRRSSEALTFF